MHDVSWTDSIFRILMDLTGSQTRALIAYCGLIAEVILFTLMPLVLLMVFNRVARAQGQVAALRQEVARLSGILGDLRAQTLADLRELRNRIGATAATSASFGPNGSPVPAAQPVGDGSAGVSGDTDAPVSGSGDQTGTASASTTAGEVAYRFCPTCRTIQMVKFSRCQACGFHFL